MSKLAVVRRLPDDFCALLACQAILNVGGDVTSVVVSNGDWHVFGVLVDEPDYKLFDDEYSRLRNR